MDIDITPRRITAPEPSLEVPTNDKSIWIGGLLVLFFGFGGFTFWAAVAPLDSAAIAPGVVAVESARKTVQHFEGGIVSEILVREGDHVTSGQLLLRMDNTEASSQLEIVRSQYLSLLAREARLIAERDELTKIAFAPELLAVKDDPRIADSIIGEQRLFESRRKALAGEKAVLQQRAEQLNEQILGLKAQADSKLTRIKLYQEEITGLKDLFKKGLGDKSRLREWERLVAELEGERAEHQASVAAARVQISETQLQINQLDRRLESEVATDLRDVETKLADLRERIRALEKTLARTEIYAPVPGSIVGMGQHTIGGVIRPGDKILDIVPNDEDLIVEAQVQPVDIDRVEPGLEADLRMSAFNTRTTPVITGKVLTVSADRLVNQQTGVPYYLARIRVTAVGMDKLRGRTLQAGMPVEVMIKTGERTFLDYLIRPLTDRFAVAFTEE